MARPLMPKATAVWLVENTTLSFEQIAAFCGLHPLEVQAIADGEVAQGIVGFDPIASGQITREEIERCQADPRARLKLADDVAKFVTPKRRKARYTPVSKRQDRPDAIAWLLKNFPDLTDGQIAKLVGTTKATIDAVRDRTHWNAQNIKPRDPVQIGICGQHELDEAVRTARRRNAHRERAATKAGALGEAGAAGAESAAEPSEAPVAEIVTPKPEQPEQRKAGLTVESVFGAAAKPTEGASGEAGTAGAAGAASGKPRTIGGELPLSKEEIEKIFSRSS